MRRQLALTIEVFLISTVLWDSQADAAYQVLDPTVIKTRVQPGDQRRRYHENRFKGVHILDSPVPAYRSNRSYSTRALSELRSSGQS
jgi:hypothetical protein